MRRASLCMVSVLALATLSPAPATATEERPASAGLSLELNKLEQNGAACRATMVAVNGFKAPLDEAAFELVTFDTAGLIGLMTVLDFGVLPAGKTLVRRFDLPQTDCAALSRILVNAVARCAGDGIALEQCRAQFTTTNRAAIDFGR
ncbi:hypothetical protein [Hoeflea olei]|uniref:Tat pathway signal sequence domain protein n=1 Tax=Hoeflea olei TaxID=1480615 RepID=A0A1C1YUE5_9HYPH|nr:hypothetical protein [Hoeflea olei]OCW56960.1 hypothetical protein AWJ14_07335 [Hoeflea olei]